MTTPSGSVLITGAGRGLGRALASGLATAGWDVAVLGRSRADLEVTAELVRDAGQRCCVVEADVTDRERVDAAVDTAIDTLGSLDGLVNNAGIQRLALATDLGEDDWDLVLNTNLKGPFLCMQAVARHLLQKESGSIVNIASVAGHIAVKERAAYASSKAGLLMLTRVCAIEWAPRSVRVNAVSPTFLETDLGRLTLDHPGAREQIVDRIPMGRVAQPEDVVSAVRFLLDPVAAGFITGEVLTVDGGLRA